MAHLGFTPQSEHASLATGCRAAAKLPTPSLMTPSQSRTRARSPHVLEMVPAHVAERITKELTIPTIGIGAGPNCDAQVMV